MEIHKNGEILVLSCQENYCCLFELLLQLHNNSHFHTGFYKRLHTVQLRDLPDSCCKQCSPQCMR